MPTIEFQLNGAAVSVDADPDQMLLDVLRGRLGITAAHFGCGAGECGACHVMIDGHAMTSCDVPMWSVADKAVVTLEGLGTIEQPHPLQRPFMSEQAMQCGYCVSGIMISAAASTGSWWTSFAPGVFSIFLRKEKNAGESSGASRSTRRTAWMCSTPRRR